MKKQFIIENTANHDYKSNNTYVYELINPVTNLPFYVGKGRDDRAQRHISLRKNLKLHKLNPHKVNTINQIIDVHAQLVVIRIVNTFECETDAFDCERELISKYGRTVDGSGILTNIQTGGEGAARDGIKVDQYTMWGEFIQTWKNAKEAARLNGWPNYTSISQCCTARSTKFRKSTSYKGFIWCYHGTPPRLLEKAKPIYQWTKTGEFVKVYKNATRAATEIKELTSIASAAQLSFACRERKLVYGYQWTTETVSPGLYNPPCITKRIKNINTGMEFASAQEAAEHDNTKVNNIYSVVAHQQKSTGGYTYEYV